MFFFLLEPSEYGSFAHPNTKTISFYLLSWMQCILNQIISIHKPGHVYIRYLSLLSKYLPSIKINKMTGISHVNSTKHKT